MQPPPDVDRLFLALWPAPGVLAALARWQRQWSWPPGAAVVARERWHLTLHFIGDVPRARRDELRAALAVPVTPCDLPFGRAEAWPRGLAVLMPHVLPPELVDLHARLADALRTLGLPVERRAFRPHLTLARRAAGARAPDAGPDLHWPVRGYRLVRSAGGYFPLARYGGDAPPAGGADDEETHR